MIKINELSKSLKENISNEVFLSDIKNYFELESVIIVEYKVEGKSIFYPFNKEGKQIGYKTYDSFEKAVIETVE